MCGIAGSFGVYEPANVGAMVDRLAHRGPDGHGVQATLLGMLGHTRLAIIDPAAGHQPMHHDGAWICFNGEIYNYRALRDRYLSGEALRTNSDTEVILRLYQLFGPGCVQLLEGMFAFAIINEQDWFLARDPLGIKPLYYTQNDQTLRFASEIKAFSAEDGVIESLPPGAWYHRRLGLQRYYSLGQGWPVADTYLTQRAAQPAIRQVLSAAVRRRLLADVPIGVSLSGGLDSSIIALLAREEIETLETFAVGMEGGEDLPAARAVAAALGTKHHEYIYTQDEIEAALPSVLYHLESCDPALVRSAIPNYFLAQLAAGRVKVILTGEGADELYAGYDYMAPIQSPQELQRELLITISELHRTNLQRADRMFMAFGVEGRVPFLDVESVALALSLPPEWKIRAGYRLSKLLLRQVFATDLPPAIVVRPKQKFSSGAGSSHVFATKAEQTISDAQLAKERAALASRYGYELPNKEALYYLTILREQIPEQLIIPGMGASRSL
jgi:asparagine synthase (glutamine-hydrolysing)